MVESTIWFGVGAATFGGAIVSYLAFAVLRGDITSPYYFLPPIHALIAGAAYVTMALIARGTVTAVEIDAVRYADWALSTPIITYYLAMLAGTSRNVRLGAVVLNVLMIAAGYASTTVVGTRKWGLFAVSSLFFLGLIYLYLGTFSAAFEENPDSSVSLFTSLRDLTVVIWTLYPLVYVLGPNGAALLTVADHNFVTMVLDLTAKVGFMGLMVVRQYELNTFVGSETTAAPG